MSFHRNARVGGVEVRTVHDSARPFCCYSSDFEFLAPASWQGEMHHRGRKSVLEPGRVLCLTPGDVYGADRVGIAGTGSSLVIEPGALATYVEEHASSVCRIALPSNARMSPALAARLGDVFGALHSESSALEVESALVEFFALAMPELLGRKADELEDGAEIAAARRIRDYLQENLQDTVDLDTLAREARLTRFRALRVFKRQFGLPPHAYHLRMRLGLAQRCLRNGLRPAEVAAECGFADQSHLTRHFKRLYRVTPAAYAQIGARAALDAQHGESVCNENLGAGENE